eukprot:TRINITY_DN36285_c0_g1_i1.p1 TRINITY_DN36285_c0_g1~~TRINITY_DN36285_c0_g1_i1.p1  ORF type:complete len:694 (+),score=220.01 TRINITY_DN36285_c0_g1_i1:89-2083(+)
MRAARSALGLLAACGAAAERRAAGLVVNATCGPYNESVVRQLDAALSACSASNGTTKCSCMKAQAGYAGLGAQCDTAAGKAGATSSGDCEGEALRTYCTAPGGARLYLDYKVKSECAEEADAVCRMALKKPAAPKLFPERPAPAAVLPSLPSASASCPDSSSPCASGLTSTFLPKVRTIPQACGINMADPMGSQIDPHAMCAGPCYEELVGPMRKLCVAPGSCDGIDCLDLSSYELLLRAAGVNDVNLSYVPIGPVCLVMQMQPDFCHNGKLTVTCELLDKLKDAGSGGAALGDDADIFLATLEELCGGEYRDETNQCLADITSKMLPEVLSAETLPQLQGLASDDLNSGCTAKTCGGKWDSCDGACNQKYTLCLAEYFHGLLNTASCAHVVNLAHAKINPWLRNCHCTRLTWAAEDCADPEASCPPTADFKKAFPRVATAAAPSVITATAKVTLAGISPADLQQRGTQRAVLAAAAAVLGIDPGNIVLTLSAASRQAAPLTGAALANFDVTMMDQYEQQECGTPCGDPAKGATPAEFAAEVQTRLGSAFAAQLAALQPGATVDGSPEVSGESTVLPAAPVPPPPVTPLPPPAPPPETDDGGGSSVGTAVAIGVGVAVAMGVAFTVQRRRRRQRECTAGGSNQPFQGAYHPQPDVGVDMGSVRK